MNEEIVEMVEDAVATKELGSFPSPVVLVSCGIACVGVGVGIGYLVAKKRLDTKYDKMMEEELAKTRAFYQRVHKSDFPTPADAVEALIPDDERVREAADAIRTYQGQVPPETETRNIFQDNNQIDDPDWDQEKEESSRTETAPYILHHDEFMAAEPGYEQISITYYAGDDVLADEEDKPIDPVTDVVGEDNLQLFGHGSGDENVIYIRNDRLNIDFEITRSNGKYAYEVLGFEEELKHSSAMGHGVRKFRVSDE